VDQIRIIFNFANIFAENNISENSENLRSCQPKEILSQQRIRHQHSLGYKIAKYMLNYNGVT